MTVDRTPSTINKLKKAREIEEECRRIRALAKAKMDAIAEERARLEEAQRVIHVSEDDAVDALSVGLTRQSLLLEDASQDVVMAEQTIAKLLVVVKNQEKLMRRELENKRELQSLRESMQRSKAEKWELPLTAKSQQISLSSVGSLSLSRALKHFQDFTVVTLTDSGPPSSDLVNPLVSVRTFLL
jgi:hypothetical protein